MCICTPKASRSIRYVVVCGGGAATADAGAGKYRQRGNEYTPYTVTETVELHVDSFTICLCLYFAS